MSFPASADPSAVFQELLDRLEAEDWAGAVALHTAEFVEVEVGHVLRSVHPPRKLPTVDGLLGADPQMPREVAEYEVDRARRAPLPSPYFYDLYDIESEADVEALSSSEIFARYLHGRDYRWRWRLHIEALIERHPGHRDALEELLAQGGSPWHGPVAGHVEIGDRAHVVYGIHERPAEEYGDDLAPSVAVMRRTDSGWRVSSNIVPGYATAFGPARVPDGEGGWTTLT